MIRCITSISVLSHVISFCKRLPKCTDILHKSALRCLCYLYMHLPGIANCSFNFPFPVGMIHSIYYHTIFVQRLWILYLLTTSMEKLCLVYENTTGYPQESLDYEHDCFFISIYFLCCFQIWTNVIIWKFSEMLVSSAVEIYGDRFGNN